MRNLARSFLFFSLGCVALRALAAQGPAPVDAAASAAAPMLLAKFTFEDTPAWVPNWGAAYNGSYKPATGWKKPFVVKLDPEDPHSGDHALRFELLENRAPGETGAGERLVHSPQIDVPAPGGEGSPRLVLHFALRTRGIEEGRLGIRVLERDAQKKSLGLLGNQDAILEIAETPTWKVFVVDAKLRRATRSLAFMVVMQGEQSAPATVWLDDVSVEHVAAK